MVKNVKKGGVPPSGHRTRFWTGLKKGGSGGPPLRFKNARFSRIPYNHPPSGKKGGRRKTVEWGTGVCPVREHVTHPLRLIGSRWLERLPSRAVAGEALVATRYSIREGGGTGC
jgi:hypothetical protein